MRVIKRLQQQALEFPSLFSDDELDSQHVSQRTALQPPREDYHPLPIIEAHFPRIAEIIQATWGTPELDAYLDKLLIDQRGDRSGFPSGVVEALLALSCQHIEQFGFRTLTDVWIVDPNTHKSR